MVACAVCNGTGLVVWKSERGVNIPKPPDPTEASVLLAENCPACDGTGIEPGSDGE